MSDSITPSGTTRTAFSISTNDLEINGDVTAGKFIGSGEKITDLNIDSINRGNALSKSFGGTNNNTYIHQGLVFNNNSIINNDNKFLTSSRIRWDNQANILYINDKNIVQDSSNYVNTTSSILFDKINTTSNIIISDILAHIENTLGIDNTNGIPIASTSKAGVVKVGEGLFVSTDGFLSIMPEVVQISTPSVVPNITLQNLQQFLVKSVYKKYIFTYNPNLGTTFDNDESIQDIGTILPIWYNFSSIVESSYINNKGNSTAHNDSTLSDSLILYGNATIKPDNSNELIFEYTPLNNNYLHLDGTDNSYAELSDKCNIQGIYGIGELGGSEVGITFAFWFKCSNPENLKSFMFLGSDNSSYYINIGIDGDNNITLNIFNFGSNEYKITQYDNLLNGDWVHISWSIDGLGVWTVYINNVKEDNISIIRTINPNADYNKKYLGKSRYDTNNTLECSISDFRIYNKVLNDSQINELFNANNYTEYILTYYDQDNGTGSDIIMLGAGGGGSQHGGGGSGKLIYIDNAIIYSGDYRIKVGRGGSGNYTTQLNSKGNDTVFDTLVADGGGSYGINDGIGGSGSGNGGTNTDNIPMSYSFLNTNGVYLYGNNGYIENGGGGGAGTSGYNINGGDGVFELDNSGVYVNFKDTFDLPTDNSLGYYNSTCNYLYLGGGGSSNVDNGIGGLGGGGDGSSTYDETLHYNGRNGSGGGGYDNYGAVGGDGIVILRFLDQLVESIKIPESVLDASNYVLFASNQLAKDIIDNSNYINHNFIVINNELNNNVDILNVRINNLNTDNIHQNSDAHNKFIIDNVYSDDLLISGTLTINNNLLVLGETTTLETDVYATEQLDIVNSDIGIAFNLKQYNTTHSILNVSNNIDQVFTITNDGSVGIGVTNPNNNNNKLDVNGNINIVSDENNFIYTIDGRDIIQETSNHVDNTSNLISANSKSCYF